MSFDFDHSHNVSNAVIYCRVSSKAQVQRGDGLQSQQTRCEAYADYKDYDVKRVFTDDLTGRSSERPGLTNLLSFLQSDRRNPHVVIIDDITRFARKVSVHFELRETIARAGGILESPSVELRDDADGELHEYILASVSQHQSRKNAEQTRYRMQARLMNGYWTFAKPKGYIYKAVKGQGKILVRDEPVASIIEETLVGFASGRFDSQIEVKRFLESQTGFPKDLPDGTIRHQRVKDLLKQPLYAGYLAAPKWDISLRKAQHEGLISFEVYQKIQQRLIEGANAPARKDMNADFPLRNFVLCGDCEKPLTACWSTSKTGKKHPYYLCFNKGCVSHRKSIQRDRVEAEFEKILEVMQPTNALLALTKTLFKDLWQQRLAQLQHASKAGKQTLSKMEKQIDQLLKRIVETDNPAIISAYEDKIAEIGKERLLLREKLENNRQPRHTFDEMFELALSFLGNPHRIWASGHLHLRKIVLRMAFGEPIAYHLKRGFSNPKKSLPFKLLGGLDRGQNEMARPEGFEPPTTWFEATVHNIT